MPSGVDTRVLKGVLPFFLVKMVLKLVLSNFCSYTKYTKSKVLKGELIVISFQQLLHNKGRI